MSRFEIRDFSGLLNTRVSPLLRKTNELAVARNVETDPLGALSKRSGYTRVGDAVDANSVVGLHDHAANTGTHTLLRVSGTKVYKLDAGAFSDITGSVTLTSGSDASMATLNGTTAGFNVARNAPWKWTGSGNIAALGGTPPSAKYGKVYKNKLYVQNTSANPYRTLFSAIDNAESWTTATDYFDLPDSTEPGTGLGLRNDRLVAHNGFSSYRWDTNSLVKYPVEMGAVAQTAVVETGPWEFVFDREGIYANDGALPKLVSEKIRSYIEGIAGSALANINGGAKGDFVYYATTDATQDISAKGVLRYNYRQNNWAAWDFAHTPNVWTNYIDTNTVEQLAFGDTAGNVWYLDSSAKDDGGTRIESEFEWGPQYLFGPEVTGDYQKVYVIGSGLGQMNIQAKIDDEDWQDIGVISENFARLDVKNGQGRGITIRGTEASSAEPWKIYAIVIYAERIGAQ